MKRTKSGRPDLRTKAGKTWLKRSEAAKRGWVTRRLRESEEREPWYTGGGMVAGDEIIVEEPIETVGGPRTQSGKRGKR